MELPRWAAPEMMQPFFWLRRQMAGSGILGDTDVTH
jgi:hypothetical protein